MRFTNKASTNTRSHSTTAEIQRNTPKNEALGNTQHCIPSKGSNKQSKLTVLSTLIWEGRWELALKRLKSTQYRHEAWQEIDLPCFPSGKYEGMPLHLASAMRPLPPASFIQELLGAFPEACRIRQTSWELLPLHLASDLSNHQMTGCALESTLAKTLDSYEKESNSKIIEETLPKLVLMNSNSEPVQIRCSVLEASRSMYEYANHAKIVDMLLKNYSQSIFARENISGMLPLHIAALTASSENGIVSATSSVVLDILLKAAPETRVLVDGYGDTPIHLAWREARFCCYQCGNKGPCLCQKHKLSVPKRYIHPLLRDELSLQGTATSTHTGLETPNTGSQKCDREKYTDEERQNDNKDDYEDDRNDMPTFKGEQSGMRRENNQEDLNKKWSGLLCINNIGKKKRENTDRLSIDSEGKSKWYVH